jgi:hypothetical protein
MRRVATCGDYGATVTVPCPKCGEYGRFYAFRVERGGFISLQPFVQHGSSRHFLKRMLLRGDDRVWDMMARLSRFKYDKLMAYLQARRMGKRLHYIAVGPSIYKPKSSYPSKVKRIIIDDYEPPRALVYEKTRKNARTLHLEALNRLKEILEFHGFRCRVKWGLLWATPPNWGYDLKFYVKVGSKPIVHLNYDFERSALAVLKLKKLGVKNDRFYYEGRWLYTPLYELEPFKGNVMRLSKLPLYSLGELFENVKAMGGEYVVGV